MEPLLLITNTDAGSAQDAALEQALAVLRERTDVEVAATSNPGELDGVLHRAGSRTVVIAGGDGSVHAVIKALHRRNDLATTTLALIPLGTGNDFARTLEIPLDPAESAAALLEGAPRRMDLIVDELGGVVVNNVHAGASAQASRHGAQWKKRLGRFGIGILGYPLGAAVAAVKPPFVRLRIEADGEVISDMDQHVLMVSIGNGASVGGGTELNPDADPGDGKLDVLVSFATTAQARLGYAVDLLRRRHPDRHDTLSLRGSEVSVSGEEFWMSADGEITGPEGRRTWRIERAAYSLLVPDPT